MTQELVLGCVKAPEVRLSQTGPMLSNMDSFATIEPRGFDAAQGRFLSYFRYYVKLATKYSETKIRCQFF